MFWSQCRCQGLASPGLIPPGPGPPGRGGSDEHTVLGGCPSSRQGRATQEIPGVPGTEPHDPPPQQGHAITTAAEGPSQPPQLLPHWECRAKSPGRQGSHCPAEADVASPLPPHGPVPLVFTPKCDLMNEKQQRRQQRGWVHFYWIRRYIQ